MRIAVAFAVVLAACGPNHPSDEALIKSFAAKRAAFETLHRMFLEDAALTRVGTDFTRPEDPATIGVSKERIERYRGLCRDAGLEACIEGYGNKDVIWFHASTYGLAVTGSSKGYVYARDAPPADDSTTTFRPIGGNWYLYENVER